MARFSANFTHNLANPVGLMRGVDKIGDAFGGMLSQQMEDRKEKRLLDEYGVRPSITDFNDPAQIAAMRDWLINTEQMTAGTDNQLRSMLAQANEKANARQGMEDYTALASAEARYKGMTDNLARVREANPDRDYSAVDSAIAIERQKLEKMQADAANNPYVMAAREADQAQVAQQQRQEVQAMELAARREAVIAERNAQETFKQILPALANGTFDVNDPANAELLQDPRIVERISKYGPAVERARALGREQDLKANPLTREDFAAMAPAADTQIIDSHFEAYQRARSVLPETPQSRQKIITGIVAENTAAIKAEDALRLKQAATGTNPAQNGYRVSTEDGLSRLEDTVQFATNSAYSNAEELGISDAGESKLKKLFGNADRLRAFKGAVVAEVQRSRSGDFVSAEEVATAMQSALVSMGVSEADATIIARQLSAEVVEAEAPASSAPASAPSTNSVPAGVNADDWAGYNEETRRAIWEQINAQSADTNPSKPQRQRSKGRPEGGM